MSPTATVRRSEPEDDLFPASSVSATESPRVDRQALEAELRAAVRGDVSFDLLTRGIHATDASFYQIFPACVVVPRDAEDAIQAVRVAASHGMPLTPRGGGTALSGQTFGPGMILDCSKYMDRLLEVNEKEKWARVQPGMVRDRLNAALLPTGLHYAPDPATTSRATVGGMIGNNSSGTRSVIYGKTIDQLIACKVVLADGTVLDLEPCGRDAWKAKCNAPGREGEIYRGVEAVIEAHRQEIADRFPKVMRRVGGYNLDEFLGKPDEKPWNLSHLICGSEGTLGVLLEAKIRLVENPRATAVCVVHFSDMIQSLSAVAPMLQFGPSAIELFDDTIINEARRNAATASMMSWVVDSPMAVQIVEFYGDDQAEANRRAGNFAQAMKQRGIGYAHVLRLTADEKFDVWETRKLGLGLMTNTPGPTKALDFVDDAAIPVEVLPDYIERLIAACREEGVSVPLYAHASVGVLHVKPRINLHDAADIQRMRRIAWKAFDMTVEYGGSWSGEHGDGLVRGEFVRPFFGDRIYGALLEIKSLFDPQGLMNPGKILHAPPMVENLRTRNSRTSLESYNHRIAEVAAYSNYHYRDQGGFHWAVEQCNGVGACRKVGQGTMCPSYMATMDEEATTRGRANALRLAMSGQLDELNGAHQAHARGEHPDYLAALASPRVQEALDLCLACKACKTECPNSVDMAKLKSDVLQMHHDVHGIPLGHRVIGDVPRAARYLAGPWAPLIGWISGLKPARKLNEWLFKVDHRRPLPPFARVRLSRLLKRRSRQQPLRKPTRGPVALFDDTWANYCEPQVGLRAVELLEGLGYEVFIARAGCCQRPRMSKGLLREAKRDGTLTMINLDRFAKAGIPILCLEPSCASALVDDLPDLIDHPQIGHRVAAHVRMIDVFLAEEMQAGHLQPGDIQLRRQEEGEDFLLHGHCHQKSLFGTDALKHLMATIPGVTMNEVDSGCCGMAGSFGYDHYDVSQAIGEQRLFPAAREAVTAGKQVVACGQSCRHQLHDFCSIQARHWVEVVKAAPAS